jgi:hypothetical protein
MQEPVKVRLHFFAANEGALSQVVDAILGLRELLDDHPELVNDSLATLITACGVIIGDEAGSRTLC